MTYIEFECLQMISACSQKRPTLAAPASGGKSLSSVIETLADPAQPEPRRSGPSKEEQLPLFVIIHLIWHAFVCGVLVPTGVMIHLTLLVDWGRE